MSRHDSGKARSPRWRVLLVVAALAPGLLGGAGLARAEKRLDINKLGHSYVEALDLLAKGQRDQALETLMAAETEALGSAPSASRIDRVWRHKLGIVRKALELTSPEILVPVIVLHHDVFALYREAKQPVLARHARDMAADLATFKAQSTKSDDDRRFAGWVLASFGAALLDLRTSGSSAGILREALDLSPGNPVALLGLAWAHEIHGEYQEAVDLLRRLIEFEPDHLHARLRLGVCERRLGNLDTARRVLTDILGNEAAEPWIRSIAFQELARTLISLQNLAGAEAVAREASEEFPAEQEIAILLASLNERLGRLSEADAIIDRIEPGPDRVSARYVYDSRPDLEIEQAREKMRTMMNERLDVLASGLRWWGAGTAAASKVPAGEEG